MYKDTELYIDGVWQAAASGDTLSVINPATEEEIGRVAKAGRDDLDKALGAAERAFHVWRKTSPLERSDILRRAAGLMRERSDEICQLMTLEQGKPLHEAAVEINSSAEIIEWNAEEGRRTYGQIIPPRIFGVSQQLRNEPIGPVAAFTPWNFPMSQAARKIGAALAAGCSMIIKPPEETPACVAAMIKAFEDAGLPAGVLNMVYGVPAEISEYLIAHPVIRKISFTGSTAVGKHLAAMAGQHMKRATMELGGHAPTIVFKDADLEKAATALTAIKYRNAAQICLAPTRFMVEEAVFEDFVELYVAKSQSIKVGDGTQAGTTMGPLANERRLPALQGFVEDAVAAGGQLRSGGDRVGNKGYFFKPTVMTDVPIAARAMTEEPFGPLSMINRFSHIDQVVTEANRNSYGLAAYAFTTSTANVERLAGDMEVGMLSVNHFGIGLAELFLGGVQDSGYGSEGGSDAIKAYQVQKLLTLAPE
jgi:succinate-semialdehyde dehydrogenase/glutarate-semialdehyde dehydrogenase